MTPIEIIDRSDFYCHVADGVYFGVLPSKPLLLSAALSELSSSAGLQSQPHKLDRVSHIGDSYDNLNSDGIWAETTRDTLKFYFPETDFSQAEMLGLGAGQAHAELELAQKLGIPFEKVTLLDRRFSEHARRRIDRVAPGSTAIEQGMFSFLSNPDNKKYSLITTFGLHDAIDRYNKEEFLRLAPNVMTEGGILLLTSFAFPGKPTVEMARKYGLIAPGSFDQDLLFRYLPQEAVLQ